MKSTESLNLALVAKGLLVSFLYCSQVPFTACEYPNEDEGLLKGITLKSFFRGGLASQLKSLSFLTKANCRWTGAPHFSYDAFVCLYQRYLSSKIAQLFFVFFGTEEQALNANHKGVQTCLLKYWQGFLHASETFLGIPPAIFFFTVYRKLK